MDALERYQNVKGGYASVLPAQVQVRVGPMVQRAAASASQLLRGPHRSAIPLPDGVQRIYLFHIRKTAGTSLVRSFLALGGEDPRAVEHRMSKSLLSRTKSGPYAFTSGRGTLPRGDYFFGWSHMAAHRLRLPSRTFTIVLLRDPVARVLSYYRYLLSGDEPAENMAWRVPDDERALAGRSFSDFLNTIPEELLLNQLYMFSRRFDVAEATAGILKCSAIMLTESYGRDLRKLAGTLSLPLEHRRDRITGVKAAPVDQQQLDALRDRLEGEYELLEAVAASGRLSLE